MSRKAVVDFEVTLAQCELAKLHIYNSLEDYCNGIIVSQETHHPCPDLPTEGRTETHFHLYLQTKDRYTISALRPLLESNLGVGEAYGGSIHVSSLRNRKHWIKYITKEDHCPLYRGVDTADFHFAYRMYRFIEGDNKFNPLHPFIRQNINYARIIKEKHSEFWQEHLKKSLINQPSIPIPDEDIEWVKDALTVLQEGKHLLIEGETGLGKSVLMKWWAELKGYNGVVFLGCGLTDFEWSELDCAVSCAIGDDINEDYFRKHRQILLRLLDGGLVSINPKCLGIRSFVCKIQFIFGSNYYGLITNDPALARRIHVVTATGRGYKERVQEGVGGTEGEAIDDSFFEWLTDTDAGECGERTEGNDPRSGDVDAGWSEGEDFQV